MKRALPLICLVAGAVSGCEAIEEGPGGTRTFAQDSVPITFEVPSVFTREDVDEGNSRGDVVVAFGLSKVDVIALRRVDGALPDGPQAHQVLGKDVTSELHRVADGYVIECQYGADRAEQVREACADAVASVERQ